MSTDPMHPADGGQAMIGSWLGGRTKPPREAGPSPGDEGRPAVDVALTGAAVDGRRRVLVFLLGVESSDLGRLADLAARSLDGGDDLPVFVVTTLDFAVLRERGLVFEYLPAAADLGATDGEAYATYLRRRLAVLRLKWQAAAEIDLGMPLDLFRDRQSGQISARAGT
jgi:hypothetical protein